MDVFSFSSPDIKTNDATNNITDYVKLCKKRRESSKRNSYIISSKMMMKAIIIIGFLARSRSVKSAILLAAFFDNSNVPCRAPFEPLCGGPGHEQPPA